MRSTYIYVFVIVIMSFCGCEELSHTDKANPTLFNSLDSRLTGIHFSNDLIFTEEYNPYTFKNFFNGGGVSLGDIDNDGLLDIYLSGNLVGNKLYRNKGDFAFEDITEQSGLSCEDVWSSGVNMLDINGDGLLDIYVCKSGRPDVKGVRHNELFINNGEGKFTESSKDYGLDFEGLSVQSVFFDYDLDGDLDCYLLNNSIRSVGAYDIIEGQRNIVNENGGNKLLKCMLAESGGVDTRYRDVTAEAGIYESSIGFGLGVSVGDLNNDLYPDIFVSNDFFEKDYLYINNQDGSFYESSDESMAEMSMGSMGADIADIDNDGKQDIFVTEMLPSTLERSKTKIVYENFEKSRLATEKGYHRQYARNALHYNLGQMSDRHIPLFSEISRYAGADATEWSWGALIADFDQDGWKDIFVANGIYKDLLDQDYLNFFSPEQIGRKIKSGEKHPIVGLFENMPTSEYRNVLLKNNADYSFSDISTSSGLGREPLTSNGAAYGDLDNDGDLDLIVNNIGSKASVFRNNSNNPSVTIKLSGGGYNTQMIGSKVIAYTAKGMMVQEVYGARGFESSGDVRVQFPSFSTAIDSIVVYWPNQSKSKYGQSIPQDSVVHIEWDKRKSICYPHQEVQKEVHTYLTKSDRLNSSSAYNESSFTDFDKVRTLPFIISNEGPRLAIGDINGDSIDDVVMTSSKRTPSNLLISKNNRLAECKNLPNMNIEGESSDVLIHDMNEDGNNDIFYANGGFEFSGASTAIKDELYLSQDNRIKNAPKSLINPSFSNSAAIALIDLDDDGDKDIIVGERLKSNAYGVPADIVRYINNGTGYEKIPSENVFKEVGLIRDIEVSDINNDGKLDIIIACEYAPLSVLINKGNGAFVKDKYHDSLTKYSGIWTRILSNDIDEDGDQDIIATNIGLNNYFDRLSDSVAVLYVNDFDRNGSIETILCVRQEGRDFPLAMHHDMVMQLPSIKKQVLKSSDYAKNDISLLIPQDVLSNSLKYQINEWRTGIFINDGGMFTFMPLPHQAQWTDQRAVLCVDINGDNIKDVILGGNQYIAKPEIGANGASFGQVFLQDSSMNFRYLPHQKSGLLEVGQIRDYKLINIGEDQYIVVAKNDDSPSLYKIEK